MKRAVLFLLLAPATTALAEAWDPANAPELFGARSMQLDALSSSGQWDSRLRFDRDDLVGDDVRGAWSSGYTAEAEALSSGDMSTSDPLPGLSSDGVPTSWSEIFEAVSACPLLAADEQEDVGDDEFYLIIDDDADGAEQDLYLGLCQGWAAAAVLGAQPSVAVDRDGVELSANQLALLQIAAYSTTTAVTSGMQCSLVDGSDELSPNADDALGKGTETTAAKVTVDEDGFLNDPGEWGAVSEQLTLDEDGFIAEPQCADSNPGTFHILVTNLIADQGSAFLVDRAPFADVLLAPAVAYEQTVEKTLVYQDLGGVLDELGWALLDHDAASYVYVETTVTYLDLREKDGTIEQAYAYVLELDKGGAITGGTWAAGYLDIAPDFFMLPVAPAADIAGLDLDVVGDLALLADASMDADGDGLSDSVHDLPDRVAALGLHNGTETSLLASADAALCSAEAGDADTAANQLQAFVNKVEAQQGKKIDDELAEMLIAFADNAELAL